MTPGPEPSRAGASTSAASCGLPSARWTAATAARSSVALGRGVERLASGGRLPQPCQRLQQDAPHLGHQEGLAGERQAVRRPERRERLVEPALAGAEHPPPVLQHHLRRGLRLRTQCLRAVERPLGLLEPTRPRQRAPERHQRQRNDLIVRQPMRLGDRDRLLALLASQRDRALRGLDRQVTATADLHARPADPARQGDALLEVPPGVADPR